MNERPTKPPAPPPPPRPVSESAPVWVELPCLLRSLNGLIEMIKPLVQRLVDEELQKSNGPKEPNLKPDLPPKNDVPF